MAAWLKKEAKILPKTYFITKDGQPGGYFVNTVFDLVFVKR